MLAHIFLKGKSSTTGQMGSQSQPPFSCQGVVRNIAETSSVHHAGFVCVRCLHGSFHI